MKRKLHIGGKQKVDGWEILNANEVSDVDHLCNANDLSKFQDETFSEIYASHIVEHLDYRDELTSTLKEWWRVLEPAGKLYISVPDLDILAGFILSKVVTFEERFFVMRMLFGGHVDEYDYHVVGLKEEFLRVYLNSTGYINITRVEEFGIFDDTSRLKFKNTAISLNVTAEKSTGSGSGISARPSLDKVGRNDSCACGSGKKFKECHGSLTRS